MAEIHVQTKKHSSGSAWIWIVVVLLVAAAIVYYMMNRNKAAETGMPKQPDAASELQPQAKPAIHEQPTEEIPVIYLRTV